MTAEQSAAKSCMLNYFGAKWRNFLRGLATEGQAEWRLYEASLRRRPSITMGPRHPNSLAIPNIIIMIRSIGIRVKTLIWTDQWFLWSCPNDKLKFWRKQQAQKHFFASSLIENCFQDNWTSTPSLRHRCRGMPDVFLMMEVKSGKLGNWPHGGRGPGGHLCLCVKAQRLVWRDGAQVWFWRRSEASNFTQMMSSVIWQSQARICWRFSWKMRLQTYEGNGQVCASDLWCS